MESTKWHVAGYSNPHWYQKEKKRWRFLQQVIKNEHPEMLAFLPATALKIEKNIAVLKYTNLYCVFVERAS